MPNFDHDFSRVSRENYITGKAAINFPWSKMLTGGWHTLAYWDTDRGLTKVSLAGIHYPDTSEYFGETGILDATTELRRRGWIVTREIYMADHFRATGDMVLKWTLGESRNCNVELADWFPDAKNHKKVVAMLRSTFDKLDVDRRNKISEWLELQILINR